MTTFWYSNTISTYKKHTGKTLNKKIIITSSCLYVIQAKKKVWISI